MHLFMIVVCWLSIAKGELSCPVVTADVGDIIITHPENATPIDCKIDIYNAVHTQIISNRTIRGLFLGLVVYECGPCVGEFISRYNCQTCSSCFKNELIPECNANKIYWSLLMGMFFMGFVVAVLFYVALVKLIPRLVSKGLQWKSRRIMDKNRKRNQRLLNCWATFSSNEPNRRVINHGGDRITELGLQTIAIQPANVTPGCLHANANPSIAEAAMGNNIVLTLSNEDYQRITDNIGTIAAEYDTAIPEEGRQFVKKLIENKAFKDKTIAICKNLHGRDPNKYNASKILFATWLLMNVIVGFEACTQTIYISSEGKICEGSICIDIKTYILTANINDIICFELTDSSRFLIKIMSANLKSHYRPVYKTAPYTIKVKDTYECKGWGAAPPCGIRTRHSLFDKPKDNKTVLGHGCGLETMGCGTCFYSTNLVFWQWEIIANPDQRYVIHKHDHSYWTIDVETELISSSGNSVNNQKYTFTPIDNKFNMNDGFLVKEQEVPMMINSFNHETLTPERSLVHIQDLIVPITASELNHPVIGQVGEFQLSLDEDKSIYPSFGITCKPYSCRAECSSPEQAVNRLIEYYHRTKDIKSRTRYQFVNDGKIRSIKPIEGSLTLSLGNLDVNNLVISKPRCELNIVQTYGCTGCSETPFAIVQSLQVSAYGELDYKSNCTFLEPKLKCSMSNYVLRLTEDYTYCHLYIPLTNQTLNLRMDYTHVGNLVDYNSDIYKGESLTSIAKSVFASTDILNTFQYGMIGMSILSITLAIVKLIRLVFLHRATRKLDPRISSGE